MEGDPLEKNSSSKSPVLLGSKQSGNDYGEIILNLLRIRKFTIYATKLTLFRMGLFGAAHGWGDQKGPLLKVCHTYTTMMKLGTAIPYLKKIKKIYKSREKPLEFC